MNNCDVVKMSRCFFCGGNKNELIMTTRQTKAWCDNKSMSVIANYEPCDKCQEKFDKGTLLIEAGDTPNNKNQSEMQEGVYPTGRYWVVKPGTLDTDSPIVFVREDFAKEMGLYDVEDTENKDVSD